MKVLVVDDEKDIVEFLSYNLSKSGYEVISANDGHDAIEKSILEKPELILLDIMLPDIDGVEVCQSLREKQISSIIVMLSARNEDYTQKAAFNVGCNAFFQKPINPKLLLAKINGLLSIAYDKSDFKTSKSVGPYLINYQSHIIKYNQEEFFLPKKQFDIFSLLATKPGKIFTREEIYKRIWGKNVFVGGRTIDVHIRSIREKLGQNSIITVKAVGYKITNQTQL